MYSEWKQAALAAMERLVISMGCPMLHHVEVAYALAQRQQAVAPGYAG